MINNINLTNVKLLKLNDICGRIFKEIMSVVSRLNYMKLKYKIFVYSTLMLFITGTILLFLYLNRIQPHFFIDEVFHMPQTIRYCAWNFTQQDPKITTLPGLHLITTAILSAFNMCNITYIQKMHKFIWNMPKFLSYLIL